MPSQFHVHQKRCSRRVRAILDIHWSGVVNSGDEIDRAHGAADKALAHHDKAMDEPAESSRKSLVKQLAQLLDSPRHRDHCPADCICLEIMKIHDISCELERMSRRKAQ